MAKKPAGADRPDDYKRFAGLDKENDINSGALDTITPQSAKKNKTR